MKYSFRAECEHDVTVLTSLLPSFSAKGGEVNIEHITLDNGAELPDVKVEIVTEASFDTIMHAARCVPDGHVIVQTLRPCPLAENSLERRYA